MKHILDPTFRYYPSFATDVRKTFSRIRRERQSRARQRTDLPAGVMGSVIGIKTRPS